MNRTITRRSFLKRVAARGTTGLALPYIVRPSALGKAGTAAASERITVGFIGTGSHGIDMNLKSFLAQPDAQAVAVCDVDPIHLQKGRDTVNKKYGNTDCATYKDFRAVLARSDIDAVMISTPDHWHTLMSVLAVRAGKDVQCEKPTLTIDEGKVLVREVEKHGRVFTAVQKRARKISIFLNGKEPLMGRLSEYNIP